MNINFRNQRLQDLLQPQSEARPIKVLVHEFIQSTIFTPFPQDYELQLDRLRLAGSIYESIGFRRKAAFYRRFAALKSVTIEPNWQLCYDDLLKSLDGFGLTLEPRSYGSAIVDKHSSVWPGLHVQLLEELITCCKRIQTEQAGTLTIRHMSFMLHSLDFYLSNSKIRDCAKELEEASAKFGEDSPVSLQLANGMMIPNVNFTKFPTCVKFEPAPLPIPLRPNRITEIKRRHSDDLKYNDPFIFTPIMNKLAKFDETRTPCDSVLTGIVWAQNEHCSTTLELVNPLPFILKISSIQLLTDGLPFESKARCLNLDANSSATTVHLFGVPRGPTSDATLKVQSISCLDKESSNVLPSNRIEIFGYATHLLGVKSNCKLESLTHRSKSLFPSQYIVEVSPALPRLLIDIEQDKSDSNIEKVQVPLDDVKDDFIIVKCRLNLRAGETAHLDLLLENSPESYADMTYICIKDTLNRKSKVGTLTQANDDVQKKQLISLLNSDFDKHLPLKAGSQIKVRVDVYASPDFFDTSSTKTSEIVFEYSSFEAYQHKYCRKAAIEFTITMIQSMERQNDDPIDVECFNKDRV